MEQGCILTYFNIFPLYNCIFSDSQTQRILGSMVVHKSMATSSTNMEVLAAEKLLDRLQSIPALENNATIFTTDGSLSIKSMMKRRNKLRERKKKKTLKHNMGRYYKLLFISVISSTHLCHRCQI